MEYNREYEKKTYEELYKEQEEEKEMDVDIDVDGDGYCEEGCGKLLAKLNDWAIITAPNGKIVCSECAIKKSRYRCSNCGVAFEFKDYSDWDYKFAKKQALNDKRACEAAHNQHLVAQIERPAK